MSTTIIDIDCKEVSVVTDDEPDYEVPRRKPIGWNYQNVFPSKVKKQYQLYHSAGCGSNSYSLHQPLPPTVTIIEKKPVNGNHIESETVKVDPETVDIDAETVEINPENIDINSKNVDIGSENVGIDSNTVDLDSDVVDIDSGTVDIDSKTVDIESGTVGRLDNTSSDDIEVLEVKEYNAHSNRKPRSLFPPSSSRKEIKSIIRTAEQTSIKKFFKNEPKVRFGRAKKESKDNSLEKSSVEWEGPVKIESMDSNLEKKVRFGRPIKNESKDAILVKDSSNNLENNLRFRRPNNNGPKNSVLVVSPDKSEKLDMNEFLEITLGESEKNEMKNNTLEQSNKNKQEDNSTEQSPAKCGKPVSLNQSDSTSHENKGSNVKENGHIDGESPPSASSCTSSGPSCSKEKEDSVKEISDEDSRLVVEKFIEKWKSLGTFGHDERKIENRLWKHYNACHPTYTRSRKFINAIDRGTGNLTLDNIFKFLASIIKHLKEYKNDPYKEKKKKLESKSEAMEDTAKSGEEEEEVLDEVQLKKQRKLQRIEKAMKQLMEKINKYEKAEVDWDDDDNSAYLILDRLKRKFGELDALYCKTAECSVATGRPIEKKFRFEGSRYTEINKRIEAWVNKNRTFPDYVDILNLVKKVSKQNSLPMKPAILRKMAEDIFRDVGRVLKERREKDDFYCIYAYADGNVEMDPADIDPALGEKLFVNEKEAKENLDKVFKFYEDQEAEVIEENRERTENKKTEKHEKEESKFKTVKKEENKEGAKEISDQKDKNNEQCKDKSDQIDKSKGGPSDEKSTDPGNDIEEVDEEEEEEEEEDDDILDTDNDTEGVEDNNDDEEDDDDDNDLEIIENPPVNLSSLEDGDSRFDEEDDDIKEILAYDAPINDYEDEDSEDPFERDIDIADSPLAFEPEEIQIDEALPKPGFTSPHSFDNTLPKPGFSPYGFKRRLSTDMVDKMSPAKRLKDNTEVVEID